LSSKISQLEAAAANVRVMPALKIVADWPPQRLNSVAPLTRIEIFSTGQGGYGTAATEVVFRSWEGYGIAMLFTFLATSNFVKILVKFTPFADFCIRTAMLLMNATQMNILDAIKSARLGNSPY